MSFFINIKLRFPRNSFFGVKKINPRKMRYATGFLLMDSGYKAYETMTRLR